jgi:membrane protein YdbS with pleckstrin-like domain
MLRFINVILVLIYVIMMYSWLSLNFNDVWWSTSTRIVLLMLSIYALVSIYRIRRPHTGESIMKYKGLYFPFYVSDGD